MDDAFSPLKVQVGAVALDAARSEVAGAIGSALIVPGEAGLSTSYAEALLGAGLSVMQVDLLTFEERSVNSYLWAEAGLLAHRVVKCAPEAGEPPLVLIGSGEGAAACALASTMYDVRGVVALDGRLDLGGPRVTEVRAPFLVIVMDRSRLDENKRVFELLTAEKSLEVCLENEGARAVAEWVSALMKD